MPFLPPLSAFLVVLLGAPPPAQVDTTVQEIYLDGGYQTELPDAEVPLPPYEHRYREWTEGSGHEWRPESRSSGGGLALRSLLYGLAIVALVLLVAVVANNYLERRRVRAPTAVATAEPAGPEEGEGEIPDPDSLARKGRFAEAVHALLLLAQRRLVERAGGISPALTSREILSRVKLPDGARTALRHLVLSVESCLFGGRTAGPAEYAGCRESYDRFLSDRDGGPA
jgi:hypothetical protein